MSVDDGPTFRIVLSGEADRANLEDLENALVAIELDGAREVQLHISDLGFVDVAALRQLTAYARQLQAEGRSITTRGAQPMVEQLVRLAGVHDDLGLA